MASRATSRLGGGMGGASQYDRDSAGFGGYGSDGDRQGGDPVDRILTSLDRLGERIRTLSPVDERRPARPAPRVSEPDDLQRAIDQISRKRDTLDPGRITRRGELNRRFGSSFRFFARSKLTITIIDGPRFRPLARYSMAASTWH